MIKITVYEQELFGSTHWRVVRDDARWIFGRHQTDFPYESDAIAAIRGEVARNNLGDADIRVQYIDRQANGRRQVHKTIELRGVTQ